MRLSSSRVLLLLALLLLAPHARGQAAYEIRVVSPEPITNGNFGGQVVGLNDVDGDGRGDFAVAEVGMSRVYVYSGATLDRLLILTGVESSTLSATPDFDGDGADDLLIGAAPALLYSTGTGALLRLYEGPPNVFFYAYSAVAPDTDGDGVFDVLLAESPAVGGERTVHIVSGMTGDVLYSLTADGPEADDFGASAAGVPDVDGDGRGDIVVGAPGARVSGLSGQGAVFVFSGATGALLYRKPNPYPDDYFPPHFGASVVGMPDVNGDGAGDLLVSAPDQGYEVGTVLLLSGATGGVLRSYSVGEEYGRFGSLIAAIPDADGDGLWDVMGRYYDDPYGSTIVVFSSTGREIARLGGAGFEGYGFGTSSAGVPDFDGDGLAEFAVGGIWNTRFEGLVSLLPSAERPAPVLAVAPVDPPIVIPPDGGAFSFTARFTSQSEIWQRWRVWTQPFRDGVPVGEGLAPMPVHLDPRQDTTFTAMQEVDGEAPAGDYTYTVYVGTYPGPVVAQASFSFTKATGTAAGPDAEPLAATLAATPNPSRERTTFRFTLPTAGTVRLAVYDALGREVAVLVDEERGAGRHDAVLDASRLSPGVYVARLTAAEATATRTLVVAR